MLSDAAQAEVMFLRAKLGMFWAAWAHSLLPGTCLQNSPFWACTGGPDAPLYALQMHAIHNTWRNFEEPDRFLPERWQVPGAEYARSLQGGELASTSGKCC